jgi:hypothetical protein
VLEIYLASAPYQTGAEMYSRAGSKPGSCCDGWRRRLDQKSRSASRIRFVIPGVGPIAAAGLAVTWITDALDGSIVIPDLGALAAALCSIGIPSDSAVKYESTIKAGKYLLIAHGTPEEAESARRMLNTTGAQEISVHVRGQAAMAAAA